VQSLPIGHTLENYLPPKADRELDGLFLENLRSAASAKNGVSINVDAHGFKTLDKFMRALMVFQVFHHEHDKIVVVQFPKVLGHESFDQRFQFSVDHALVLG